MSQLSISFGLDGKNCASSGTPFAAWKNIRLKSSNLWKVAFIEIAGKSYGPLIKPTQNHTIGMKVNENTYKAQIMLDGKSIFEDQHYILGHLVVSVTDSKVTVSDLVDFVNESFYDH